MICTYQLEISMNGQYSMLKLSKNHEERSEDYIYILINIFWWCLKIQTLNAIFCLGETVGLIMTLDFEPMASTR